MALGDDPVAHLGPDLCAAEPDLDAAVERMAAIPEPGTTIAEVLLDQRVAAGIGNVYKSEVLHACRLDPFTPVRDVPVELRRHLLDVAARLLRRNLTTTRRTTVAGPEGSVAVYRRARRPCPRCGTPVRSVRHGAQARSTYWCPRCQVRPVGERSPEPRNPGDDGCPRGSLILVNGRTRVVVVGAGFGGLATAQALRDAPVEVTLVDRNNFHTFQPLLYQVATSGLNPADVAYPVRGSSSARPTSGSGGRPSRRSTGTRARSRWSVAIASRSTTWSWPRARR